MLESKDSLDRGLWQAEPVAVPAALSKVEHALTASERGWAVFRGTPGGKTPAASGWQAEATRFPEQVTGLWRDRPTCNVLVATGRASNLVVIDLDRKKGKDGVTVLDGFLAEKGA